MTKMINADEFFNASVEKQREAINGKIEECIASGNPVVALPFDTYPIVEKEMAEAGWEYDSYIHPELKTKCALFFPKQYRYDEADMTLQRKNE